MSHHRFKLALTVFFIQTPVDSQSQFYQKVNCFQPRRNSRSFIFKDIPIGEMSPQPLKRQCLRCRSAQQNKVSLPGNVPHGNIGADFVKSPPATAVTSGRIMDATELPLANLTTELDQYVFPNNSTSARIFFIVSAYLGGKYSCLRTPSDRIAFSGQLCTSM